MDLLWYVLQIFPLSFPVAFWLFLWYFCSPCWSVFNFFFWYSQIYESFHLLLLDFVMFRKSFPTLSLKKYSLCLLLVPIQLHCFHVDPSSIWSSLIVVNGVRSIPDAGYPVVPAPLIKCPFLPSTSSYHRCLPLSLICSLPAPQKWSLCRKMCMCVHFNMLSVCCVPQNLANRF